MEGTHEIKISKIHVMGIKIGILGTLIEWAGTKFSRFVLHTDLIQRTELI